MTVARAVNGLLSSNASLMRDCKIADVPKTGKKEGRKKNAAGRQVMNLNCTLGDKTRFGNKVLFINRTLTAFCVDLIYA